MAAKSRKKKRAQPIFDSIRKPVAPPTRPIEPEKAEERIHPAGRKSKYRPRDADEE